MNVIKDCDIIYVMKDSKIIEIGKHKDLIELNGIYNELWTQDKKEN